MIEDMVTVPEKTPSVYTAPLTSEQAEALQKLLRREGFDFESRPYTICFAKKPKLTVAIYEKGPKVVVQGRGLSDFVTFLLEPEILGEARFGYDEVPIPKATNPTSASMKAARGTSSARSSSPASTRMPPPPATSAISASPTASASPPTNASGNSQKPSASPARPRP